MLRKSMGLMANNVDEVENMFTIMRSQGSWPFSALSVLVVVKYTQDKFPFHGECQDRFYQQNGVIIWGTPRTRHHSNGCVDEAHTS